MSKESVSGRFLGYKIVWGAITRHTAASYLYSYSINSAYKQYLIFNNKGTLRERSERDL